MTTALITHPDCLAHVNPPGHPERVERLQAIRAALEAEEFAYLVRVEAPLATDAQIQRAHPASHIAALEARVPGQGFVALDADTFLCPDSLTAARRAAGAVVRAVDMVMAGEAGNAFCAVRPPGHHAETATPMGFCLFGNVVIGARHALEAHGLERVAIVDFDVHHGNGTQNLVWDEARILFASTQQMPLYPGTGAVHERGAHGQIVNVPLPPGASGAVFRAAMVAKVLPAVAAHDPQMILISAGFDAHARDPLANLGFTEADFAWATAQLCDLADRHCGGRIVSTLEGGYDLGALAASVAAHVRVLMERDMAEAGRPAAEMSFEEALKELEEVVARLETGQVPLEESITLYARGAELRAHCEEKLKAAEARVAAITQGPDGSVTARPVDIP